MNLIREWWHARRYRDVPTSWPERGTNDRVRVLLEYPHHATPRVIAGVLERAGYESLVCENSEHCRLVWKGTCPLVDDADVVVNGFGLRTPEHRAIVESIVETHPETALVVQCSDIEIPEDMDLTRAVHCPNPLMTSRLLAAVDEAASAV
jgi:hypothetical protein